MCKAKERLDPWDEDIDKIQSFLHIQRYEHAINDAKGIVLDAGCGLGYGGAMLNKVFSSVVAFDISDEALSYAKRNYAGPMYIRADALALPFKDECFDSVIAMELIEHVNSGATLLREIHRVLKEKGFLILSTPNIAHLSNSLKHLLFNKNLRAKSSKNPYHQHEYTSKELIRLLESTGFRIEKKKGQILTFPFVYKLPPRLCVTSGRFLPDFALHMIYEARKQKARKLE